MDVRLFCGTLNNKFSSYPKDMFGTFGNLYFKHICQHKTHKIHPLIYTCSASLLQFNLKIKKNLLCLYFRSYLLYVAQQYASAFHTLAAAINLRRDNAECYMLLGSKYPFISFIK